MKIIEEFAEFIEDELDDSEKYSKKAMCYKDAHPIAAELLYSLALEEMKHKSQLHNMVVKLIEEANQSGEVVPEWMLELYDRLHQKAIEHEQAVRILQSMFRE